MAGASFGLHNLLDAELLAGSFILNVFPGTPATEPVPQVMYAMRVHEEWPGVFCVQRVLHIHIRIYTYMYKYIYIYV